MRKQLPPSPSLASLKNQARQLLNGHKAGAPDACARIAESFPRLAGAAADVVRRAPFQLRDAQLVIAREYGFATWPTMVAALEQGQSAPAADSSEEFAPIANPYVTGNPVRGGGVFYGREDEFAFLRQHVLGQREGSALFVVGPRRAGRTSMLLQILNGRLGPEVLPLLVDMQ